MTSLQKQAISSVKWTSVQTVISGITGPVLLVVMSRFLSPDDFAHYSIIMIAIGLFRLLENFGISQAIIQKDNISVEESSTLFFFNMFLCCIIAVVLYFVSPAIAAFFDMPDLRKYLAVVTIIVLLTGPTLLFRAFLQKEFYFKHLCFVEVARNLISLIGTIVFLALGFGLWGVILGRIIAIFLAAIALFFIAVSNNLASVSFKFSPKKLNPFLRFGVFVSSKELLTFAAHHLDEVVIAYFLAPEILGIYYFGKNMLSKLRSLITSSFGRVLFPLFSKLKHDHKKLSVVYWRISRYIAFVAFPVFFGIAVTAHLFIPIVFGEQWTESIIVFQVFSVTMIFMLLTANVSSALLYSVNKPDVVFYIDLVTNFIYFVSLLLFASFGMQAILMVYFCYVIYKTITLQYCSNKQLLGSFGTYLRELGAPFAFAAVMVATIFMFQFMASDLIGEILMLSMSIIVGIIVFSIQACFFAKGTVLELKNALMKGKVNI